MKFNRILCPIDHSRYCRAVNELASMIAAANDAEIIYLHVVMPDVPYGSYAYTNIDEQTALERERLERFKPTIEGIKQSRAIDFGTPISAIVEYANQNQVDLIVLGSHGRTGLSRVLLGSVAEAVVRHARCPVLIAKVDDDSKFKSQGSVVCAIDVNDFDQHIVDLAGEFAKRLHADLDLLHITTYPNPENDGWPAYLGSPKTLIQDDRLLNNIFPDVEDLKVVRHHQSGLPVEKILAFVDKVQPRLLVMGTHGRKGLAKLLGSVASKVLRQVSCPVLVLRQQRASKNISESSHEAIET